MLHYQRQCEHVCHRLHDEALEEGTHGSQHGREAFRRRSHRSGISAILLVAAIRADRALGHPPMPVHPPLIKTLGTILVCAGVVLLLWTVYTLRSWWIENRLCTNGPFRWFRHPLYAAWITFICPGAALYLGSWVLLAWALSLHPVWHRLVIREEKVMVGSFGDEYRRYAARTGRFVPRPR